MGARRLLAVGRIAGQESADEVFVLKVFDGGDVVGTVVGGEQLEVTIIPTLQDSLEDVSPLQHQADMLILVSAKVIVEQVGGSMGIQGSSDGGDLFDGSRGEPTNHVLALQVCTGGLVARGIVGGGTQQDESGVEVLEDSRDAVTVPEDQEDGMSLVFQEELIQQAGFLVDHVYFLLILFSATVWLILIYCIT